MNLLIMQLATPPTSIDTSLWGMVLKGGWLMIPIFILSVIAVYVACERFWHLRKVGTTDAQLMGQMESAIAEGDFSSARQICESEATPLSRIMAQGLLFHDQTPGEIRQILEEQANLEVAQLEKGMATLATCAGIAPMIGFLGTVVGMIQAFYDMAMAGSSIDIGLLSRGIYTAMITTVAGLIVGIIGQFAYNFLVARVNHIVHRWEQYNSKFVEFLFIRKKTHL